MKAPTVSVIMITYGHENYIKEAIEGVLMQECCFEIELIIVNDCSPDKTDAIVQKSIKRTHKGIQIKYFKHKKNIGAIPNFIWALEKCSGKYTAICEGDDYWTDPFKLQKQADVLDGNKEIGLVTTFRSNYTQSTRVFTPPSTDINTLKNYGFYDLLTGKIQIATLTALFRTTLIQDYFKFYKDTGKKLSCLDYCIFLYIAYHSEIKVLNCNTGVYRILGNSLSHGLPIRKWELKKKYFNDVQIYKKKLPKIDENIFKKTEYDRAKGFYTMALNYNDENYIKIFNNIFMENNDSMRIIAINLSKKSKLLKNMVILFEKYLIFIKNKLK